MPKVQVKEVPNDLKRDQPDRRSTPRFRVFIAGQNLEDVGVAQALKRVTVTEVDDGIPIAEVVFSNFKEAFTNDTLFREGVPMEIFTGYDQSDVCEPIEPEDY